MDKKNRKNAFDSYSEVFFIVIGAVIGYLCFVIMQNYSEWFALPFFIFDIAFILIAIYVMRGIYRKTVQGYISEIRENIGKIASGGELGKPGDGFFYEEMSELYGDIARLHKTHLTQSQSKDNVIGIINSIALNMELEKLLDDMLPKIIEATGSTWSAFYLYNPLTEKMELKSSIGFAKSIYSEFDIALGDGFVGKGAQTDEISIYNNIPEDTVYISRTFLGKIKPRAVMTVPINSDGKNIALLFLASIYDYNSSHIEILKLIRHYTCSAIMNGLTYERTKRLKNELLFQNQLIQNMNEELENNVEERTRFLNGVLNSIADYAIVSVDDSGHITLWNTGAEIMRGFKAEQVIGKHISETHIGEDAAELSKSFEAARKDGKFESFKWIVRATGERIYAHRIIMPILSEEGRLVGYVGITRNMTSYKRLEDRAAYLTSLYDLLLTGNKNPFIIMDSHGIIIDASFGAAKICGLPAASLSGTSFASMLEDSDVFAKNLEMCDKAGGGGAWLDEIKTGAGALKVSIALSGTCAPGSTEKIIVAYIEPAQKLP